MVFGVGVRQNFVVFWSLGGISLSSVGFLGFVGFVVLILFAACSGFAFDGFGILVFGGF